jgi:beta-lactamase superfamily II metal-dependent hydrolase
MRAFLIALSIATLASPWPFAQTRATGALSVYVVDVEGGNATLFVSPSGESLLIDAGNPGARDADRIVAAARDAGLSQIDNLIVTHYHGDHVGGVPDLASRMPIRRFIDHGPSVETGDAATKALAPYIALTGKTSHIVARPGDRIAVRELDVTIVAAAGQTIKTPLPRGGAPNAACASVAKKDIDTTENAQSVGTVVTFGSFRAVHLGDLTWNKELELMCPANPIGPVDLFLVSHHGLEVSNSPALVHGLRPRVAIMNNGVRKGGAPDTMKTLYSSPGLEDLWQLHFSLLGGQEYAVPGLFIANPQPDAMVPVAPAPDQPAPAGAPGHDGPAFWIKVVAQSSGTFVVTNSRNNFSKTYAAATGQRGRASTGF